MKKTPNISKEDSALFREAVGNIKPLKLDSVVHDKPKPSPNPTKNVENDSSTMQELFDSEYEDNQLERGDELFFTRPGIQKQTLRKLRRGKIKIDEELDLHGMTVEVARKTLHDFLIDCQSNSWRCVSIIHGKGIGSESKRPIIKNKVNNWLRQRDDVMAFCSATRIDGGTGAIYCLIKRT